MISNRVHWAKTFLTKAGLLKSTKRAHFRITKRGITIRGSAPTRMDNKFPCQRPEFVDSGRAKQINEKSSSDYAGRVVEPMAAKR